MVESETPPPAVLIADDVLGGFFALNGGRFAAEGHSVEAVWWAPSFGLPRPTPSVP
jgi:hypothetical protein